MEHSEATESMASARYLLGELTDEERNAFEEHYFGCGECAADVRSGSSMIDSIRSSRSVAAAPPKRLSYVPWLVAAAASIAAAFFGIQNTALKQDAAPHVLHSYSLLTSGTRGPTGANDTVIEDPNRPFVLFVDIPPDPPQAQYRVDIVDVAGRAVVSVPVSAEEARDTVTVYVPPRHLQSGKYTVVTTGGSSSTLTRAPLTVR
jgi:anti-sigma factor RsiW